MTDSLKSQVSRIFEKMADSYEKMKWVTCPVCREEWTKLTQVPFFRKDSDGNMKKFTAYSCPPCSRSVLSCKWFSQKFGITFDENADIRRHEAYRGLTGDEVPKSGYYFRSYDGSIVATRGDRVNVYQDNDVKSFDNIVQAMVYIAEGKSVQKENVSWT